MHKKNVYTLSTNIALNRFTPTTVNPFNASLFKMYTQQIQCQDI
jgi:hypothetical protein